MAIRRNDKAIPEPSGTRIIQHPLAHPGISHAKAKINRKRAPSGTPQAEQWLAIECELKRSEDWFSKQPKQEVARWYSLLRAAFEAAITLVKQARRAEVVSGIEYSKASARLDALWPLAKAESETLDLRDWPTDPSATLAWFAEPSMLATIARFTKAICMAQLYAGGQIRSWGGRPYDKSPHSDPENEQRRDRFAEELESRLLPKAEWWGTMGLIHRDVGVALNKLHAEYSQWAGSQESCAKPVIGSEIVVWSRPVFPVEAARACDVDKRTLLKDTSIKHRKPHMNAKKYQFDIEAIARIFGDDAAEELE